MLTSLACNVKKVWNLWVGSEWLLWNQQTDIHSSWTKLGRFWVNAQDDETRQQNWQSDTGPWKSKGGINVWRKNRDRCESSVSQVHLLSPNEGSGKYCKENISTHYEIMFEISDLSTRINRRIYQDCHVSIGIRSISNSGKFNIEIWKSEFKREFSKFTKSKNKNVQSLNLQKLESYDGPAIGENSIDLLRLEIRPARGKGNVSWIFFYRSVISRQSTLYSLSNERNTYEQIRVKKWAGVRSSRAIYRSHATRPTAASLRTSYDLTSHTRELWIKWLRFSLNRINYPVLSMLSNRIYRENSLFFVNLKIRDSIYSSMDDEKKMHAFNDRIDRPRHRIYKYSDSNTIIRS